MNRLALFLLLSAAAGTDARLGARSEGLVVNEARRELHAGPSKAMEEKLNHLKELELEEEEQNEIEAQQDAALARLDHLKATMNMNIGLLETKAKALVNEEQKLAELMLLEQENAVNLQLQDDLAEAAGDKKKKAELEKKAKEMVEKLEKAEEEEVKKLREEMEKRVVKREERVSKFYEEAVEAAEKRMGAVKSASDKKLHEKQKLLGIPKVNPGQDNAKPGKPGNKAVKGSHGPGKAANAAKKVGKNKK